jgi:multidrug transporter EmrE-like cation transporter
VEQVERVERAQEVDDRSETTKKEGERRMLIGLIVTSVLLAGAAQVTLKVGVNRVTAASGGTVTLGANGVRSLLGSWVVWIGLAVFAASGVLWMFALSKASLSFAYPFAALGYIVIVAASVLILHESVPPLRWVGVAFIAIGIVLVANTPHA